MMVDGEVRERDVGWARCVSDVLGVEWDVVGWSTDMCRRF